MWFTLHVAFCIWWGWMLTDLFVGPLARGIELFISSAIPTVVLPKRFLVFLGDVLPRLVVAFLYFSLLKISEWPWFRFHPVWQRVRDHHLGVRFSGGALPHLAQQQVIYAVAPHSMYAEHVTFGMVLNPLFEGVTVICTSLLFWLPFVRECVMAVGAQPAKSAVITQLLDEGRSIIILPEGLRGVLHDKSVDVLRGIPGECAPRKGFLRCALGSKPRKTLVIVPVYAHGARPLYRLILPWPRLQSWALSQFYYTWFVIQLGWYGTCFPKAGRVTFCVGEPIPLYDGEELRDIDELHAEFCQAMERLSAEDDAPTQLEPAEPSHSSEPFHPK